MSPLVAIVLMEASLVLSITLEGRLTDENVRPSLGLEPWCNEETMTSKSQRIAPHTYTIHLEYMEDNYITIMVWYSNASRNSSKIIYIKKFRVMNHSKF